MQKILLTSESELKINAVKKFFDEKGIQYELTTVNCDGCKLPPQPFIDTDHDGFYYPKERMNYAAKSYNLNNYDYVVAIESGIRCFKDVFSKDLFLDVSYVLILHQGILSKGWEGTYPIPKEYLQKLFNQKLINYNDHMQGYPITIGELIHQDKPSINPKNWFNTRPEQINSSLTACFQDLIKNIQSKNELLTVYKSYDNYPKPGVNFHDIFPLFKNPKVFKKMIDFMVQRYKYDQIDYVIGLESRGFVLGTPLAYELGIGFVPVRKAGKLPGEVIQISYGKEYGVDVCEMQKDIPKGSKVLLVDDLIATGGSMQAAVDLCQQLNCEIVDCCVLREVKELREKCQKTMKKYYTVLLQE